LVLLLLGVLALRLDGRHVAHVLLVLAAVRVRHDGESDYSRVAEGGREGWKGGGYERATALSCLRFTGVSWTAGGRERRSKLYLYIHCDARGQAQAMGGSRALW
jgi:hypothetical protein